MNEEGGWEKSGEDMLMEGGKRNYQEGGSRKARGIHANIFESKEKGFDHLIGRMRDGRASRCVKTFCRIWMSQMIDNHGWVRGRLKMRIFVV